MIRRRLSLQLFLVLLLASGLPLAGAAALSLHQTQIQIEDQIERDHKRLATSASTLISSYLNNASAKIEAISKLLDQRGVLGDEALAQQLSDLLLPADEFLGLRYEDNREVLGGQLAAVAQGYEQQKRQIEDQSVQGSFQGQQVVAAPEALNFNNPILGSVLKDLPPGETRLATSIELFGNGAFPLNRRVDEDRVLSADLRLDPLSNTLEELTRGSHRELVLLHPAGRVLAASSPDLHPPTPHGDWLETRHSAPEGWTLVVREPRALAFAPLDAAWDRTRLWGAAGAGLAVALSLIFATWILRPIRKLTAAAERLQAGELTTRAGIERTDEIGQLARAFDGMAAAVESLDRAKSEFVSTVSHELRTPLTAMKVSVENLIDGVGSEETLPRLRGDIDRLIRLVNELLELARLEAGAAPLEFGAHELSGLADSCLLSLRPLLEAKELQVERAFTPGPTRCDEARLRQVLTNLLDNAIKAAPPGGTIEVLVAPGRLEVSDSGPGVPPKRAEEIFRPFAAGGGIGLSIAQRIVRLHGGSISVAGSRFSVTLDSPEIVA